jgi:uncharacterized membrane protein YbaN (DUF454 family)
VHETCPIAHARAERAAEALPGPLRCGVYFAVGALSVVMGVVGIFGRYLRDYRERGVVSARVRTTSLGVMWLFMGLSGVLLWQHLWAVSVLVLTGVAVTAHLLALPTAGREAAGK